VFFVKKDVKLSVKSVVVIFVEGLAKDVGNKPWGFARMLAHPPFWRIFIF